MELLTRSLEGDEEVSVGRWTKATVDFIEDLEPKEETDDAAPLFEDPEAVTLASPVKSLDWEVMSATEVSSKLTFKSANEVAPPVIPTLTSNAAPPQQNTVSRVEDDAPGASPTVTSTLAGGSLGLGGTFATA